MNKPQTEHVLIRTTRTNQPTRIFVLHDYGKDFDFTDYSYWRTTVGDHSMEEWVPTAELELYKRTSAFFNVSN